MTARHRLDGLLQVIVDVGVVEDRLGVDAEVVVDDEVVGFIVWLSNSSS